MIVEYRNNWNGSFESAVIVIRGKKRQNVEDAITKGQPAQLYDKAIPLSIPKFKDLQVLKNFCNRETSQNFFASLCHNGDAVDQFHLIEISDDSE